jgi:hypothetical protein
MTLRSEIRAILVEGPATIAQIAKRLGRPDKIRRCLHQLKHIGHVKYKVNADGESEYSIAKWPTEGMRGAGAPPQGNGKRPKASHARSALALRPHRLPEATADGASVFAINDVGQLALKKGLNGVVLEPEEFARLRTFIERTDPVWNSTEG